jgi:hypothetical protein
MHEVFHGVSICKQAPSMYVACKSHCFEGRLAILVENKHEHIFPVWSVRGCSRLKSHTFDLKQEVTKDGWGSQENEAGDDDREGSRKPRRML